MILRCEMPAALRPSIRAVTRPALRRSERVLLAKPVEPPQVGGLLGSSGDAIQVGDVVVRPSDGVFELDNSDFAQVLDPAPAHFVLSEDEGLVALICQPWGSCPTMS